MLQLAPTTSEITQQPASLKERLQAQLPFNVDIVLTPNQLVTGDGLKSWTTLLQVFWTFLQEDEE